MAGLKPGRIARLMIIGTSKMNARHNLAVINNSSENKEVNIEITSDKGDGDQVWTRSIQVHGYTDPGRNPEAKTKKTRPVRFDETGIFQIDASVNGQSTSTLIRKPTQEFPDQIEVATYIDHEGALSIMMQVLD